MKKLYIFLIIIFPSILFSQANIIKGEYFFENDPGFGNGTEFSVSVDTTVDVTLSIPLSSIDIGFHRLYFRFKDANGRWGMYMTRTIYVSPNHIDLIPKPKLLVGEYYFNSDPGYDNGTKFTINQIDSIDTNLSVPLASLEPGYHRLYFRFKDANGKWGMYMTRTIYISPDHVELVMPEKLFALEYFIGNDPGFQNGNYFTFASTDTIAIDNQISIEGFDDGIYSISYRFQNTIGIWGQYYTKQFFIGGAIFASSDTLDFNTVDIGDSLSLITNITNTGTIPIDIYNIISEDSLTFNIEVPNQGNNTGKISVDDFEKEKNNSVKSRIDEKQNSNIKSTNPTTTNSFILEPDASQDIIVTFTPTSAGSFNSLLYVLTSADTVIVNLSGIGLEPTGVYQNNNTPRKYSLAQNYPNPFNPTTMISYTLPTDSKVKIEIFNTLGQRVSVLVNQNKVAGYHETTWNANNLTSGLYLIKIIANSADSKNSFTQVKKALLLK